MGPVVGRLFSIIKMRAFAFVLLAAAAVVADSDPYTIGQVASGLTHGGVVTGVDYSNGVVSGVGAIGNRAYAGHVGYAGVGHLGYANHVDADPYTIGQVAAGLPVHNAYATGYPHNVGVVTGTTYSTPVHHGYTSYAAPAYTGYAGHLGYAGLGYAGLGYTGAYYG